MNWLSKHLKLLKDIGKFRFKKELDKNAPEFLSEIGISDGQTVLDFGCGSGTYTIPAAKMVGERGTVYAQDVDEGALDKLMDEAKREGIENVKRIDASGEEIPLEDDEIDRLLLIDVLHEVENKEVEAVANIFTFPNISSYFRNTFSHPSQLSI